MHMLRSGLIGLAAGAAVCAFASSAFAAGFGGLVGNTSVCTAPDGGQTKVTVHEDGSFQVKLPDGSVHTGTGVDDGKTITFTETGPDAGPPVQTPSSSRSVGDTWTVEARGVTQQCVLVAGQG
jgi:hypothetical protein